VNYLPAESDSGMFGGNSNWRGPVWMPVNVVLIRALMSYPRTARSVLRDMAANNAITSGPTNEKRERNSGSKLLPMAALGHASCFLPAFLAAAHLFFMAKASRFRPAGLMAPRRDVAVRFDAVPVRLARFAAQRFLVASMILLRPSGLRCLLRGWPLLLGVVTFAEGLFPATSRRADMARSMADRCVSS
jgi:hypothetical protein